jgi:hypothetical protein
MKKRIFSTIIAVGASLILFLGENVCGFGTLTAHASEFSSDSITIDNVYTIPDGYDWCTYYVVVATNNTGKDIAIGADFVAVDGDSQVLSQVHDYSEAVKKGQQFILYGQFKNEDIDSAKNFDYNLKVSETDNCTYSSVNLDAAKEVEGDGLQVQATNYSEHDIQGVGVRTVFLKDGEPVAFDTVNIADVGYVFHGGSTNSQVVGINAGQYDDYIMTYTSAGNTSSADF